MSLLWHERYVAALSPTRVALIGRGRALVGEHDCIGGDSPAWAAPTLALGELLAGNRARRGSLDVVLSGQFARFCLLPWSEDIGSRDELDAYARIRFEELYGAAAAGWSVCVAPAPVGHPRLAAAIDGGLRARLQELAAAAGARLNSVQPYLTVAFDRLRRWMRDDDFMFVVAESGRGSVLAARDGRWLSVRSTAGVEGAPALATLIERESEMLGYEVGAMPSVYLHDPGRARGEAPGAVRGVVPVRLNLPRASGASTSPVRAMAEACS